MRANADQHVDVIGRAVDDGRGAVHFTDNAAQVGEQIVADFGSDERAAIFGAEYQVNEEIAGGMRQDSFAPSELGFYSASSHGLRRGLHSSAASRLERGATELRRAYDRSAVPESLKGGNAVPRVSFRHRRASFISAQEDHKFYRARKHPTASPRTFGAR